MRAWQHLWACASQPNVGNRFVQRPGLIRVSGHKSRRIDCRLSEGLDYLPGQSVHSGKRLYAQIHDTQDPPKPTKCTSARTPSRPVLEVAWQAAFGRPLSPKMRRPLAALLLRFHEQETAHGGPVARCRSLPILLAADAPRSRPTGRTGALAAAETGHAAPACLAGANLHGDCRRSGLHL